MMMLVNPVKWIWALAHLFCISVFAVQLYSLLPSYLSPTMTFTEVRDVELKDLDFPFDFVLCVHPLLNDTTLKQLGYNDSIHYKYGRSKFNSSFVGWGGHTEQFGTLSNATEVLRLARIDVRELLKRVDIFRHSKNNTGNINIFSKIILEKVSWVDDCHVLNMSKVDAEDMKDVRMITFSMSEDIIRKDNISVELKLQGRSLATRRDILEHSFYSSGDLMTLSNRFSSYVVKIKKTVFEAKQADKNCRPYPNADFASYKECDSEYMRVRINDLAPDLDLTPPWITDDLNRVSTKPQPISSQVQGNFDLFIVLIKIQFR